MATGYTSAGCNAVVSIHLKCFRIHHTVSQNDKALLIYSVLRTVRMLFQNFRTVVYAHVYKNIERLTAHTIVSWPNPKQWVKVHTSDLMMIIRQSIYILSIITKEMGKLKTHSLTYCIMDKVCTMMIMRWFNVQTNEYDLHAKTYLTICTHHKLHNTNENKFPVFPECICNKWQNMM